MGLTDKFDQHKRRKVGKIEPPKSSEESEVENFSKPGYMRSISFIHIDGEKEFFSYADLTNGAYTPEENKLLLTFRGAATVILKGRNLDQLYEKIRHQITKDVACVEKRYDVGKTDDIVVHEIIITELL